MENNNSIIKQDNTKLIETIASMNISEKEKQELTYQLISNDVDLIKNAKQKIADSWIAQWDISNFLNELAWLSQQGMYATSTLEAKTGSGKITMQFKGWDTKLIIPVLVIIWVVIIAVSVVFFLR